MTRTTTCFLLPLLAVPLLMIGGCARPQRTPEEVAGRLSPPAVRYGHNLPGGITMAPTGGGAGGSEAANMIYIYGRTGGSQEQPISSVPGGDAIAQNGGHRMSPTTNDASEGFSSSGSGTGDAGVPLTPEQSFNPQYAPGADVRQSLTAKP